MKHLTLTTLKRPHGTKSCRVSDQAIQLSCCCSLQIVISQTRPKAHVDQAFDPLDYVALHVTLIEPERKFVHIVTKAFSTGVMINAMKHALQNSPQAFDTVARHSINAIFGRTMVDTFVPAVELVQTPIPTVFISMQNNGTFYTSNQF